MKSIEFFVMGLPKPAGSKTGFPIYRGKAGHKEFTGKVAVVDASKGSKDWKRQVAEEARDMFPDPSPWTGPLSLHLTFYIPYPKKYYGTGKHLGHIKPNSPRRPIIRPDVLKYARGVEDALSKIAWNDDSQIVIERLEKVYTSANPRCLIRISEVEEEPEELPTLPQPDLQTIVEEREL